MELDFLWLAVAVPMAVLFAVFVYYAIRKQYAKRKVAGRSTEEKIAELNADLEPFGFLYDEKQDVMYSAMYPWQRELGYCRFYDRAALALNMAIQSEPIYFQYDNRRWLIEFWKGQYGLTTGAEVGIYVTDKEDISVPGVFEGPFFDCVRDEERITMQYVLYRENKPVLSRRELHWWLTGFAVGTFSKPKKLSMEIELTFPNYTMLRAFAEGLRQAGYEEGAYRIYRTTVQITFEEPKSKQPYCKAWILFHVVQWFNRFYCMVFQKVTKDFIKTLDKMDYLRFLFPWMYRMITGFVKPKKRKKAYEKIVPGNRVKQEVER